MQKDNLKNETPTDAKYLLALVAVQGELFDKLCIRCNLFIDEYDGFCDSCASDYEYSWCMCLKDYGFKDYSEAVKKIGRKKINKLLKMENTLKHTIGEKAKVQVWMPEMKESQWLDCEITDIVNAVDRDYRVNVKLNDGKEYHQCAPECVAALRVTVCGLAKAA